MILFFDTETNGLPGSWKAPLEELENWPRLVQLAWLVCDESGHEVQRGSEIIYPKEFGISDEAAAIHGITNDRALAEGRYIEDVIEEFLAAMRGVEILVAHNMAFDEKIIGAELLRMKLDPKVLELKKICTMKASAHFCNLPGRFGGVKWPKLSELHQSLFGEDFENAHDALADIEACARCFWKLRDLHLV